MEQKKSLRILELAPQFPFPSDDGGKISIANTFLQFASQGNETTFFTFYQKEIPKSVIDNSLSNSNLYLFKHSTNIPFSRIAKAILSNKSLYIEKHINEEIKKEIRNILEKETFDIIHSDHSCMAPLALYAKSICGAPVGIRLHNIEYIIWQRYADALPKYHPKKYFVQSQAELLRKQEQYLYEKADVCFSITAVDKERSLALSPNANVIVASAGVDLNSWKSEELQRDPNQIVIATTFNWVHNIDALSWFIDSVLPLIKNVCKDAYLSIIGKNIPKEFYERANLKKEEESSKKSFKEKEISNGLHLLGYVPTVLPYLNKASVYIAPLFVGSGIRIKILEAMAMELPVVATPVSAEGIEASEQDGLFVCSTAEDFAEKVLFLLNNPKTARELGKKARELIKQKYTWERNIGIMIKEYKRLLNYDY